MFSLLFLCFFGLLLSCNRSGKEDHSGHGTAVAGTEYTCPMHPEVVSDKPGQCPICKMNLEPKDKVLELLSANPGRYVLSSQRVIKAERKSLSQPTSTTGIIAFDERRNNVVSAYIPGRIEELLVKYDYTFVKKGQPVLTLYSPELLTAQEEYLFILQQNDPNLAAKARKRLQLLGMTEAQLNSLQHTRKPQMKVTIFSPYEGYLQFPTAAEAGAPAASGSAMAGGGGMSGIGGGAAAGNQQTQPDATTSGSALREGMYVTKGQALFQVNDLKKVWAVLTVPAGSAGRLAAGSPVTITSASLPGKKLNGKIDLVEPFVREGQRQVSARVYLDNPEGLLKPNTLVQATIEPVAGKETITLPASAVWNLGRRNIVWVRTVPAGARSFIFEAREVTTGGQSGEFVEITGGLEPNTFVAKEAGFMTDSEAFIQPK